MLSSLVALDRIFDRLVVLEQEIASLNFGILSCLSKGAVSDRFSRINALESIRYAIVTDEKVSDLLQTVFSKRGSLGDSHLCRFRYLDKLARHSCSVPFALFEAFNSARCANLVSWHQAHHKKSFSVVEPDFTKMVSLVREVASAKAEAMKCSKYEAMVAQHDEDLSVRDLDSFLAEAGGSIRFFLSNRDAGEPQSSRNAKKPKVHRCGIVKQRDLWSLYASTLGIDSAKIDFVESSAVYSAICDGLSIGYCAEEHSILHSFLGVALEMGCLAFVYPGINNKADSCGMAMSSFSNKTLYLLRGFILSRVLLSSEDFLSFFQPKLSDVLNIKDDSFSVARLCQAFRDVDAPGLMSKSGVLTYPVHLMLRYTIEKALIDGAIQPKDLPDVWADDVKHYLDFVPKNDAEGCLQDLGWGMGVFGLCPVSLFAFLCACCLFELLLEENIIVPGDLASGALHPLLSWVEQNLSDQSAREGSMTLLRKIMRGSAFRGDLYTRYLKSQYKDGL